MGLFSSIGNVIGSITGANNAQEAAEEANSIRSGNINTWKNLVTPDIEKQKLDITNADLVADYKPELEEAILLGKNKYEDIKTDSNTIQAQLLALDAIQRKSGAGMSLEDRAMLDSARRNLLTNLQPSEDMKQQNLGNSGLAIRDALMNDSRDQNVNIANEMMNNKMNAKLSSLNNLGTSALGLQNQEFGEQSNLMSQRNDTAMKNITERANVNQRNVSSVNEAALQLAKLKQAQADQKATNINTKEIHDKSLLQQDYENQKKKLEGITGQYQGQAKRITDAASAKAAGKAGLLDSVASIGASLYNNRDQTPVAKEYGSTSTIPKYAKSGYTGEGYGEA